MAYTTFHLRSPDVDTFLTDAKSAIEAEGIDPYEKGLLRKDDEGNDVPGQGVDVIEPNRWYETKPTYNDDGTLDTEGTLGGYALINVRVKDPEVKAFLDSFSPSDPAKDPSEIAEKEKIGGGTHRVTKPDTPVREFATADGA